MKRNDLDWVLKERLREERRITPDFYKPSPGQLPDHVDHRVVTTLLDAIKSSGVKLLAPVSTAEMSDRDDQRCYAAVEAVICVDEGDYVVDEHIGNTVYIELES